MTPCDDEKTESPEPASEPDEPEEAPAAAAAAEAAAAEQPGLRAQERPGGARLLQHRCGSDIRRVHLFREE